MSTHSPDNNLPKPVRPYVGFLLSKAAQTVIVAVERALEPYHISSRDFGVLLFIAAEGPQPQAEIGRQLRIDRTTMVKIVDQLEIVGFVNRERDPNDRRAYALHLSEAGQNTLEELKNVVESAETSAMTALTAEEATMLRQMLLKLA